jgi:hypothetical protein
MSLGRARAILAAVWMVMSIPLIVIIFLQTLNDNYEQWDTGFGWLIPLVFPVLSFMFATYTISETATDRVVLRSLHGFVLSTVASIFYLTLLYVVVLSMPREEEKLRFYIEHNMKPSSWYLGTVQGLVIALVGKFFLDHVPSQRKK